MKIQKIMNTIFTQIFILFLDLLRDYAIFFRQNLFALKSKFQRDLFYNHQLQNHIKSQNTYISPKQPITMRYQPTTTHDDNIFHCWQLLQVITQQLIYFKYKILPLILMPQLTFNSSIVHCFLSDPHPDIYIILGNVIFPLHKEIVEICGYFKKQSLGKGKVHIMKDNLDVICVYKQMRAFILILQRIYDKTQSFPYDNQLLTILDAAIYLQYKKFLEELMAELRNNYEEFGFFLVLKIADKLKIDWLLEKCCKDILTCNFEQININKIDLFDYDRESFISIIRKHNLIQQCGIIEGLRCKNIKKIIKQYEDIRETAIHQKQLTQYTPNDQYFKQSMLKIKAGTKRSFKVIRKRSKTWDTSTTYQVQPQEKQQSVCSSGSSNMKQQIQALTKINSTIHSKNQNMIGQINEVKSTFSKQSQSYTGSTHDEFEMEEKFTQIEKEWIKQEEKIKGIIKKIKTYKQYDVQKIIKEAHRNIFSPQLTFIRSERSECSHEEF